MLTFRSLLDFIYISQYATHDDQTLTYLEDALKTYHANKSILKTLHIREHLNIPKFHSLVHYVDSIKRLGTTDNYNTEMFKRLHIDCAKKAWHASNHKNVRPQMTKWLERREKIAMFETLCAQLHTKSSDAGADSDDSDDGSTTFVTRPPTRTRKQRDTTNAGNDALLERINSERYSGSNPLRAPTKNRKDRRRKK